MAWFAHHQILGKDLVNETLWARLSAQVCEAHLLARWKMKMFSSFSGSGSYGSASACASVAGVVCETSVKFLLLTLRDSYLSSPGHFGPLFVFVCCHAKIRNHPWYPGPISEGTGHTG